MGKWVEGRLLHCYCTSFSRTIPRFERDFGFVPSHLCDLLVESGINGNRLLTDLSHEDLDYMYCAQEAPK